MIFMWKSNKIRNENKVTFTYDERKEKKLG